MHQGFRNQPREIRAAGTTQRPNPGKEGVANGGSHILSAAIAQLGERQTEDLKVPGSIPGLGTFSSRRSRCPRTKISRASRPLGGFSPDCIQNELLHPRHTRPVLAYRVDTSKQPRSSQEMATVSNGPPTFLQITGLCGLRLRSQMRDLDTLGIEPRASRMLSGCDTTTPCALHDASP